MIANIDIHVNVFAIAREIRVKSTGHRTVSGYYLTTPVRHRATSYGARPGFGRCKYNIQTPAGARTICDHEKILKNRPVPGRLSNSPMICKSAKSYDVSFICDYSISM